MFNSPRLGAADLPKPARDWAQTLLLKKGFVSGALGMVLSAALLIPQALWAQSPASQAYPGIGRVATPKELAAWDIDVRADFKGLPPGSGSVAKGQVVWEAKCASCHGVFGESNEVFNPIIGGTKAQDLQNGRVASLSEASFPGRTTLMKLSTLSTLWDYINRAMPWNAPKSLSVEEVYAVTAYVLNLGGVVPDDFSLSDQNIAQVQQRLPNRLGKTTAHALWPGPELGGKTHKPLKPDVQGSLCMRNCEAEPRVASLLPDYARNAHGNLAEQNRAFGPQRGADTSRPEPKGQTPKLAALNTATAATATATASAKPGAANAGTANAGVARALLQKHSCTACHADAAKLLGPSWAEVAKKYPGQADYLARKIKGGGTGVWGAIAMPPQALSDADANTLAAWLAAGAGR